LFQQFTWHSDKCIDKAVEVTPEGLGEEVGREGESRIKYSTSAKIVIVFNHFLIKVTKSK
jgi:hypothetical protein